MLISGLAFAMAGCGLDSSQGGMMVPPLTTSTSWDPNLAPVPVPIPPSESTPQGQATPSPRKRPGDRPGDPAIDAAKVTSAVRSVAPRATVGAIVLDRTTGATRLSVNPDQQFYSASLVKLLIAMEALDDDVSTAQVTRMLSVSDDEIASALWVRLGGASIVTDAARTIGLTATRPPDIAGRWGNTLVSARDVVKVYQHVLALPERHRSVIVNALASAPRHAADGFDQYFGIPDGLGKPFAVKQGWGNSGADHVLHSTGLVGTDNRYVVVLLTGHRGLSSWSTAGRSVTTAAQALASFL
ncbi:serine hydrolase [Herbihabitans rhizosphaerae]|uniref:serine hydrolase n=1 Tax=Herbihabitans rhizosphaerae TaxID=1872711 RepID=UPI00102AE857|nr:serine hydrolase [Herbihabitans rhizosphaerae]